MAQRGWLNCLIGNWMGKIKMKHIPRGYKTKKEFQTFEIKIKFDAFAPHESIVELMEHMKVQVESLEDGTIGQYEVKNVEADFDLLKRKSPSKKRKSK